MLTAISSSTPAGYVSKILSVLRQTRGRCVPALHCMAADLPDAVERRSCKHEGQGAGASGPETVLPPMLLESGEPMALRTAATLTQSWSSRAWTMMMMMMR